MGTQVWGVLKASSSAHCSSHLPVEPEISEPVERDLSDQGHQHETDKDTAQPQLELEGEREERAPLSPGAGPRALWQWTTGKPFLCPSLLPGAAATSLYTAGETEAPEELWKPKAPSVEDGE